MASETEEKKQASLMGLPPELRLRIYGFLFARNQDGEDGAATRNSIAFEDEVSGETPHPPVTDPSSQIATERAEDCKGESHGLENDEVDEGPSIGAADLDESSDGGDAENQYSHVHCCSVPDKENFSNDPTSRPVVCSCYGILYPQILSTSKLICSEATPVFYGNVEFRALLPTINKVCSPGLSQLTYTIPEANLQFISSIALVQTATDIGVEINRDDKFNSMPALDGFWPEMIEQIPNVKDLRLHLDVNHQIEIDYFDFEMIAGLTGITKLRSVEIQTSGCRFGDPMDFDNTEGTPCELSRRLVAIINRKAKELGKKIEVTTV